ncbi:hypothetical protein NY2A_b608R [Paramecium bursaria Chlorella virus NY2A]|uniref:Uncharacterized protein b608R n=1 Tax=Paramecium bursaria Chlorella virus NY2A TaxID=46021 RepID=A7IXD3_PBCVN|nr:hypothetical protein NY2A_b608R [Paramecium bursaria Chlorella virus NY2A]ABT15007.1 hypothetical protein NY2A_b608R [Paramecium bursaria Chlorella virus NY2A]
MRIRMDETDIDRHIYVQFEQTSRQHFVRICCGDLFGRNVFRNHIGLSSLIYGGNRQPRNVCKLLLE